MFNKILKKLSFRVVTNFLHLSIIFFSCGCFFCIESSFNFISVAKASTNLSELENKSSKALNNTFDSGILPNPYPIPRSQFFDKDNAPHILKEFRKNFVILYFWASWCMECHNDIVNLERLKEELRYREIDDIVILAISIDFKPLEQLELFLRQKGIKEIPLFTDPKKQLMGEFGVHSLPSAFLINQQGEVVANYKHPLNWSHNIILDKILELKIKHNENPKESTQAPSNPLFKLDDKKQQNDIITNEHTDQPDKQPTFIG